MFEENIIETEVSSNTIETESDSLIGTPGIDGVTFTPSVSQEGIISWTNDGGLPNPEPINIKGIPGDKGDKGEKGDTYTLTEQDKQDISSMTVESSESMFNQYYNGKLEDFNDNAGSKTTTFDNNYTSKLQSFNENAISKTNDYNTNATNKTNAFDSNANSKTETYNNNHTEKLSAYNTNATSKVNEYNTNTSTKLQEYNTNADNKIAEYDLHSQELNNKVIATRNELERVKNDVLETGTDTDTYIHLEDSAMAEYQELEVDGVCEQETTSGKNLFDSSILKGLVATGVTITWNDDGTLELNGTYTGTTNAESTVNVLKPINVNGIMNICVINGTASGEFRFNLFDRNQEWYNRWISLTNQYYRILTTDYTFDKASLSIFPNTTFNHLIIGLQVESGSTATSYEPYTGGQPSPNPDYPQSISTIENSLKITSCNKNLFDKDNVTSGYRLGNSGYLFEENGHNTSDFVRVKSNTQYFRNITISLMECVCTYNEKKEFIERLQSGKSITTNNEINYIRIVSKDVNLDIMQVEENTQSTPYEQHLETQINANLPEGEFIGKINDTYKDTLKVEYNEEDGQYHLNLYKNVGKVVLDGSENIEKGGVETDITQLFVVYDCQGITQGNGEIKSNYFIYDKNSWDNNTESIRDCSKYTANSCWIRIKKERLNNNTVNSFKNWLSTNKPIVYYSLETPYVVDLGIVDMPITYNEVTNLFTDSDLLPQINAKYYRNFISTVRNLQVNEKALKQELVDINNRLSSLESAQTSVMSESEVIE